MRTPRWAGITMIALLGLILAGIWPGRRSVPEPAGGHAAAVAAVPALPDITIPPIPPFVGVVLPFESVELSARLDGAVRVMNASAGDRVTRGQLLAVIDPATITPSDVAMADAEVRSAEAEMNRVTLEWEQSRARLARTAALKQQQLVPEEQFTEAQFQERLAQARVKSAESQIHQKRAFVQQRSAQLAWAEVRAPFDGSLAARYLDRGAPVARGTPLFRLVRTIPLRLRFAVPSEHGGMIVRGAPVSATIVDAGLTLDGAIEAISAEIDSASQMLVAEAILQVPTGSGELHLAGRTAGVRLRAAAVPETVRK